MSDPRQPLAGRFAFSGFLRTTSGPRRWVATESDTGRRVVAIATEAGRLATFESAKGVKHRHLASIVQVVRDVAPQALPEGVTIPTAGGVAIAEHLPGTSLRAQLEAAPLNPAKAVAWTLRLAEAVQTLHQAGAVHGAISLRSVVAEPEGRKIAPVLSQLLIQPVAAFCPPERLRGSVETSADDVWALHAVLYAMLTRELPFKGGARDALLKAMLAGRPKPLAAFGVNEPVLNEILVRGLIGEKRLRVADLPELVQALDGWERDRTVMPPKRAPVRAASRGLADIASGAALGAARDDGIVLDDDLLPDDEGMELRTLAPPPVVTPVAPAPSTFGPAPSAVFSAVPNASVAAVAPVPLPSHPLSVAAPLTGAAPAGTVVPAQKRVSINPFEKKKQIWPLLLIAALGGGGGVYVAVAPDGSPPKATAAAAPLPPPATTGAPKPAKKRLSVAEERDACVVAYYPEGAFKGSPSFDFICSDKDFREIATSLNQLVSAPPADATAPAASANPDVLKVDAGVKGSGLDWYELPATAIIRRHCCTAAPPLTLPESAGWCEQLQSAVRRVADDSSKAVDLAPAARDFDKAVNCLFANKIARPYPYEKPPNEANRAAFQQFLGRAAVSDARR